MGAHEGRWTDWLREQPPVWPRREAEEAATETLRWQREPEPYEDRGGFEPYPGATVLDDLGTITDEAGMLRVLARYTLVRLLVLSSAERLRGPKLLTERRVVLEHVAMLPVQDWERHAMERVAHLCTEEAHAEALEATLIAAECAAKRGHALGAFALYRATYEIARDQLWWQLAARAARGIAQLARLHEAAVSARLWQWRARVCDVRLHRLATAPAAHPQEEPTDGP